MKRAHWIRLAPSLLLAGGILASTALAVLAAESKVWVLCGPLLLALALVAAQTLSSRWGGGSSRPSPTAWLTALALLLASAIVAAVDSTQVALLLPLLGVTLAFPAVLGGGCRRACTHERGLET